MQFTIAAKDYFFATFEAAETSCVNLENVYHILS